MRKSHYNRRTFLKTSLKAATVLSTSALIIPGSALGKNGAVAASDRINVGCIGVGDRGTAVMRGFLNDPSCQVVAVSDVKSNVLKAKQQLVNDFYDGSGCIAYADFSELTARKDIDACMVATCDHWHVLASLDAVRNGKDVYCEKPMGLTLEEDLVLQREIHKNNRMFQFGTQQRSDPKFQLACEMVRAGKIGDIHTINIWAPGSSAGGDPTPVTVPEWVDYDRWLGPAPKVPYTKDRCSNALWWFVSDYALGFIAGWGIHPVDIAFWGAPDKFKGPWTLEGTGKFPTEGVANTAMDWDINIKTGAGTNVRFTGAPCPKEWQERYGTTNSHGTAFEGSEGWIFVRRGEIKTSPKSLLTDSTFKKGSDSYTNSTYEHASDFLKSIKTRNPSLSEIDTSVQSDSFCHVSDIAIRSKRQLLFDTTTHRFIDDAEANSRLSRSMRKPWHL